MVREHIPMLEVEPPGPCNVVLITPRLCLDQFHLKSMDVQMHTLLVEAKVFGVLLVAILRMLAPKSVTHCPCAFSSQP